MPSDHLFSEAFQCTRIPVREVPISADHPAGLVWERPCKCPCWQNLQQEVIEGTDNDGGASSVGGLSASVKRVRIVQVSGCLHKLSPWIQAAAVKQTNAALAEVVKLRQENEILTLQVTGLKLEVAGRMGEIEHELGYALARAPLAHRIVEVVETNGLSSGLVLGQAGRVQIPAGSPAGGPGVEDVSLETSTHRHELPDDSA